MLYTDRTVAALLERRDAFRRAQQAAQERRDLFSDALDWLEDLSKAEIEAAIAGIEWPGARPTVEQDGRPAVIPFPNDWSCHQDARGWALDALWGVTTFAADGSQIWLGADACSIPVGVVQIGWFENRHVDGGDFIKDVAIEILSPEELAGEGSRFADRAVEWCRFRGEVEAAIRFMEAHSGDEQALAFFDGPLVLPFLRDLSPERAREYVALVERLLAVSEESGVPLVGYVEPSDARDLVNLVARVGKLTEMAGVTDATLLARRVRGWGERSRLFECARYDGAPYFRRVYFAYLKTTRARPPTRVEIPAWVLEAGRADWVFDTIRAECVVGTGYPYALETADATAVLTAADREHFLALYQQFAETESLPLSFSKKALSKRGRRV